MSISSLKFVHRKSGTNEWKIAKVYDQNELLDADYSLPGIEDSYGYATIDWAFEASQLKDGKYEIIAQSICKPIPNAPADFNSFSTSIIEGTVDRKSPSVYGQTSMEKDGGFHFIKAEAHIHFSEDILCTMPYTFTLDIESNGKSFDNDDLKIKCSKDTIGFVPKNAINKLKGKEATLIIDGVQDLVGNKMKGPYKVEFTFTKKTLSEYLRDENQKNKKRKSGRMLEDNNDSGIKYAGCDGVDQNLDGIIDDCTEDNIPPSLSIQNFFLSSHPRLPQFPFIKEPVFSTIEDARDFLLKNIAASDDCAANVKVDVSSPSATCDTTLFEVIATDPRCGDVNPIQIVTKNFLLHVDDVPPTLYTGFHAFSKAFTHHSNKQILFVNQSDERFVNVLFWYEPKVRSLTFSSFCTLCNIFFKNELGQLLAQVEG